MKQEKQHVDGLREQMFIIDDYLGANPGRFLSGSKFDRTDIIMMHNNSHINEKENHHKSAVASRRGY